MTLPGDAVLGSERVPKGKYDVRLGTNPAGPTIELVQAGRAVVSELATRDASVSRGAQRGGWLWTDTRQEKLYRVYYQVEREVYFIVLTMTP